MAHDSEPVSKGETKPKKPPYPIDLTRQLIESKAFRRLTGEALKLLAFIVDREDRLFRKFSAAYFNHELQDECGMTKAGLIQARTELIEHGLLTYTAGGKGIRGKYRTQIPAKLAELMAADPPTRAKSLFPDDTFADDDSEEQELCSSDLGTEPTISSEIVTGSQDCGSKIVTANDEYCHDSQTVSAICGSKNVPHLDLKQTQKNTPKQEPSWGEVELRFFEIELKAAAATARDAKAHGCSASLCMAVAEHFAAHPGAWDSPGVVRAVLLGHPPSLPADHQSRWPPASGDYAAKKKHKFLEADSAKEHARVARSIAGARQRLERMAELDQRFGKTLDAMPQKEMLELCDSPLFRLVIDAAFNKSVPVDGSARLQLLKAIEGRHSKPNVEPRPGPDRDNSSDAPPTLKVFSEAS